MKETWKILKKRERRLFVASVFAVILALLYCASMLIYVHEVNKELEENTTKEVVVDVIPAKIEVEQEQKPQKKQLGRFKLTAYCSCEKCCGVWANNRPVDSMGNEIVVGASGHRLLPKVSVAVDPSVIPYGTKLEIEGKTYIAHDCGGAIKGNKIDVYFDNHQEALQFGVKYRDVYVVGDVL